MKLRKLIRKLLDDVDLDKHILYPEELTSTETGLLVLDENGYDYRWQAGGVSCEHPTAKGLLYGCHLPNALLSLFDARSYVQGFRVQGILDAKNIAARCTADTVMEAWTSHVQDRDDLRKRVRERWTQWTGQRSELFPWRMDDVIDVRIDVRKRRDKQAGRLADYDAAIAEVAQMANAAGQRRDRRDKATQLQTKKLLDRVRALHQAAAEEEEEPEPDAEE